MSRDKVNVKVTSNTDTNSISQLAINSKEIYIDSSIKFIVSTLLYLSGLSESYVFDNSFHHKHISISSKINVKTPPLEQCVNI